MTNLNNGISEKQIKIEDGVIHIDSSTHEIKGYELKNDNPCHCLHLGNYHGEKVDIAIYPDSIAIQSKDYWGKTNDGIVIKFSNEISYKVKSKTTVHSGDQS